MEQIQYWWAIFEEDERDYILGWETWSIINLDNLQEIKSDIFEYNQLEFADDLWPNLCTLYAPLWMFSCNNNEVINWPTRKKLAELRSKEDDFDKNAWWRLDRWNKVIVDNLYNWIVYRVNKANILPLINKNYVVNIGMYVWWDVNKADDDWLFTIAEIDKIVNAKYWHSTLARKEGWQDNYKDYKKPNLVKIEDLEKFINSWFVYTWCYIILPNKVVRDYFNWLIKSMTKLQAFEYYDKISEKLYPRERKIFQWCLQKQFIGKINTPELKSIIF